MTPLAYIIAKDFALPLVDRRLNEKIHQRVRVMDDLHFFECTAIEQEADCLAEDEMRRRSFERKGRPLAFLPAARTWLEYSLDHRDRRNSGMSRAAVLLQQENQNFARLTAFSRTPEGMVYMADHPWLLPLGGHQPIRTESISPEYANLSLDRFIWFTDVLYGFLAIINSPKIIEQVYHKPHKGFERSLKTAKIIPPSTTLNGWTEIKLNVHPPKAHANAPDEPVLTGKRAQHFVRSHLRIRLGKLELVSPHWRGDPALGIRQTRYSVMPIAPDGELFYAK